MTSRLSIACLLTGLLVTGCHDKNSNDPGQALFELDGTWVTDACVQETNELDEPVNKWDRGLYTFDRDGTITFDRRQYSNATCAGTFVTLFGSPLLIYTNFANVILQEGLPGGRLSIESIPETLGGSVDVFYYLDEPVVCFSNNLSLDAITLSLISDGSTAIDFDHCLRRSI
jgi:hypothetical protein